MARRTFFAVSILLGVVALSSAAAAQAVPARRTRVRAVQQGEVIPIHGQRQQPMTFIQTRARDVYVRPDAPGTPDRGGVVRATRTGPF